MLDFIKRLFGEKLVETVRPPQLTQHRSRVTPKQKAAGTFEELVAVICSSAHLGKRKAIVQLTKLGDKRVPSFLTEELTRQGDWADEDLILALGKVGGQAAVEPLKKVAQALGRGNETALIALFQILGSDVVAVFMEMLRTSDWAVRLTAVGALFKIEEGYYKVRGLDASPQCAPLLHIAVQQKLAAMGGGEQFAQFEEQWQRELARSGGLYKHVLTSEEIHKAWSVRGPSRDEGDKKDYPAKDRIEATARENPVMGQILKEFAHQLNQTPQKDAQAQTGKEGVESFDQGTDVDRQIPEVYQCDRYRRSL